MNELRGPLVVFFSCFLILTLTSPSSSSIKSLIIFLILQHFLCYLFQYFPFSLSFILFILFQVSYWCFSLLSSNVVFSLIIIG